MSDLSGVLTAKGTRVSFLSVLSLVQMALLDGSERSWGKVVSETCMTA